MKLATRIFKRERGDGPEEYYITSPFGQRIDPITGKVIVYHNGCDYGTHGNKWPQYALEQGHIDNVFIDQYGAKDIWVSYPRLGYKCLHGHLDSFNVSIGQEVDENTILGYTGMTGKATGIHLHLGVKYIGGSDWIDPESIDYQEGPEPPEPSDYPFQGVVHKGSAFYNQYGQKYSSNAKSDFEVQVQGELNGMYQVYATRLNPNVVYTEKYNVTKIGGYPFNAVVKQGTVFYNEYGQRYRNPAKSNFEVQVLGEVNGRYQIYATRLNPNVVYCDKSAIM
jgi:murein DD-endopeptidase MepM/ murein hydrolase activator NlpD